MCNGSRMWEREDIYALQGEGWHISGISPWVQGVTHNVWDVQFQTSGNICYNIIISYQNLKLSIANLQDKECSLNSSFFKSHL